MAIVIKKRRDKKPSKKKETHRNLPTPPMIGRNALIRKPTRPEDYSGEEFRTLFRQRLLEGEEVRPEYSSGMYGAKYGTRDWNAATKQAKAHIKKYNSTISLTRLRAEFLERLLFKRVLRERPSKKFPYPEPPKSWENVPPPSSAQRKTKSDS